MVDQNIMDSLIENICEETYMDFYEVDTFLEEKGVLPSEMRKYFDFLNYSNKVTEIEGEGFEPL